MHEPVLSSLSRFHMRSKGAIVSGSWPTETVFHQQQNMNQNELQLEPTITTSTCPFPRFLVSQHKNHTGDHNQHNQRAQHKPERHTQEIGLLQLLHQPYWLVVCWKGRGIVVAVDEVDVSALITKHKRSCVHSESSGERRRSSLKVHTQAGEVEKEETVVNNEMRDTHRLRTHSENSLFSLSSSSLPPPFSHPSTQPQHAHSHPHISTALATHLVRPKHM